MPRRRVVAKRPLTPDAKYNSKVVSKFINHLMLSGKKNIAKNIVYGALERLSAATKDGREPIELLEQAIANVKPPVEVRSRRVGGATYQVPVEVSPIRALTLAVKWIIAASKKQSGKSMQEKLAKELKDALNGVGVAVKTKVDKVKMAEANKAFASYRW